MLKWKYYSTIIMISLLFIQSPIFVSAKENPVNLFVNGAYVNNATAYEYNDTMYIPFRAVFEHLRIPFQYDSSTQSISYTLQGESYSIDIEQDIIYSSMNSYQLLIPLLLIEQRTYIPQQFVEDLLKLEVNYDEKIGIISVNSLDHAYNEIINYLAKSYYEYDMPASLLFTYDANPYGSLESLYHAPNPLITQVIKTEIGTIKYYSINEAIVSTSQLSKTEAVTIKQEVDLHFRKEGNQWKISRVNYIKQQTDLLDDVNEKAASLMQTSPDKVKKVLSDLQANYDALTGNDVIAAISAYSPKYEDKWNEKVDVFSWAEVVEHSIIYPSSRTDLLEAKVISINDNIAVVHVKLLYTELPQTYGGLYEEIELEEPHKYEEILYLDHTNSERWTFYESDQLNSNY